MHTMYTPHSCTVRVVLDQCTQIDGELGQQQADNAMTQLLSFNRDTTDEFGTGSFPPPHS